MALEESGDDEVPPIPIGEEDRLMRDYEAEARAKALTGPPAKRYAAISVDEVESDTPSDLRTSIAISPSPSNVPRNCTT
jgi:hypothetical protein